MDRKHFIRKGYLATAGLIIGKHSMGFGGDGRIAGMGRAGGGNDDVHPVGEGYDEAAERAGEDGGEKEGGEKKRLEDFPVVRVAEGQRKFRSAAVEKTIREVQGHIGNKEIAWLFGNCFPNTLDTTVDFDNSGGRPDTYVITGDIDAMWLRDSSAQVWPYLALCKEDEDLQHLIKGVLHRQAHNILLDPYANAFYKNGDQVSPWKHTDVTDMKNGIHERKWEIDSLCYPIRLSYGYWKQTGDLSAFDEQWVSAMRSVVDTFRVQQRFEGRGPYTFQRNSQYATDSVPMKGYGYPAKPNGLICSMFRPSDDATILPYLIPSNFFAVSSLRHLAAILKALGGVSISGLIADSLKLADTVQAALVKYAAGNHLQYGKVIAYEADGFGNQTFMDDANVPSLLSLPYLVGADGLQQMGFSQAYTNTRNFVLSPDNPFFFSGKAGKGIGGPHVGLDMIWPLSLIMRGLTSHDDKEIKYCLDILQHSHAGTGFMHESFYKDDAQQFSRPWFAWANTLFGEFILKVYKERPALLG